MGCLWVGDYSERDQNGFSEDTSFEEWYEWAYKDLRHALEAGFITKVQYDWACMDVESARERHFR